MNSLNSLETCRDLIIIGAGGIGRETAYIIEEINRKTKKWNIIGIIDDNPDMWGQCLNGHKVLGGIEYLKEINSKPYLIIAISNCQLKKDIVDMIDGQFSFATIIHPNVNVSKYVSIGEGTIIYEGTVLTVNTIIGNHALISGNCGIGHDTVIGDYSTVLWGSNLSGYNIIGKEVFIGVGVTIVQSTNIDDGTKVDAGSIIKNIDMEN